MTEISKLAINLEFTNEPANIFIHYCGWANPKTPIKGGYPGWLCKLFGKFWLEYGQGDLPLCLR